MLRLPEIVDPGRSRTELVGVGDVLGRDGGYGAVMVSSARCQSNHGSAGWAEIAAARAADRAEPPMSAAMADEGRTVLQDRGMSDVVSSAQYERRSAMMRRSFA